MSVFSDGYKSVINRELRNALEPVDETGFFDNAVASYNHFINEEQSISRIRAMQPEMDANFDSYVKTVGAPPPEQAWAIRNISASDADLYKRAEQGDRVALSVVNRTGHIQGWKAWQFWRDVEQEYPEQIISYDQMVMNASNKLANEREKNQEVMKRASGLGQVGQFVGVMGGALTDPINVATLGFGSSVSMAKGLGNAYKLAELSAKGFAISAGTEALIQPNVYKFKKEIGAEYSASDAIENILIAGVGGGALSALPLGAKITYKGFKKNIDSAYFNLAKSVNKNYAIGLEAKASLKALEALKTSIDTSPFKNIDPSLDGVRTHLTALDKAVMDFRQGKTADVKSIVRNIDDTHYPAWSQLETIKSVLERESTATSIDVAQTAKDLDIYSSELVELNKGDALEKIQQELLADKGLNKRRAKKEAKKFIESRKQELEQRVSQLERDIAPARAADESKQVLDTIRRAEAEGKAPKEILEEVRAVRTKIVDETPLVQPTRRVTQRMPTPDEAMQQRAVQADEAMPQAETEGMEQYRAYESQSVESGKVAQGANKSLYSDIEDIDLINAKTLQDVEARLADDDFMIPDDMGNLVSARQVLDEAIKGVDNAAELRACFIG